MNEDYLKDAEIYTEHLAQVNRSNKVKATENIYNQNRVLLVAKGLEITSTIAGKVAQHKLRKAVEHSVDISHVIDAQALYSHINNVIRNRDDLTQIHQSAKLDKPLLAACEYYSHYKILVQKVTVLSVQLDFLYQRVIIGAWFALAISREMNSDTADPREAFLVALVRDLGYLHLPKSTLENKSIYSVGEKNAIKSHPLVAKLILEELRELPSRLKVAASEHHERCDGTGFPKAKMANQLSLLGQVVAMADQFEVLCRQKNNSNTLWLGNLTAFLSLNMTTHFKETYVGCINMIKKADLSYKRIVADADMPEFISDLLKQQKSYINLDNILRQLQPNLNIKTNNLEEKLVIGFTHKIHRTLVESGIVSDEYTRWIEFVANQKLAHAFEEMESIGLMYQELGNQFKQVVHNLELFLSNCDGALTSTKTLRGCCEKMSDILKQI